MRLCVTCPARPVDHLRGTDPGYPVQGPVSVNDLRGRSYVFREG